MREHLAKQKFYCCNKYMSKQQVKTIADRSHWPSRKHKTRVIRIIVLTQKAVSFNLPRISKRPKYTLFQYNSSETPKTTMESIHKHSLTHTHIHTHTHTQKGKKRMMHIFLVDFLPFVINIDFWLKQECNNGKLVI